MNYNCLKDDTVCFVQQKRKLRIFISNTFNPAKPDAEDGEGTVASWELRVEGRLLEDVSEIVISQAFKSNSLLFVISENSECFSLSQSAVSKYEATKQKRKFSSFFKSLVIELDKDLYGPDNHLVEVRFFKLSILMYCPLDLLYCHFCAICQLLKCLCLVSSGTEQPRLRRLMDFR